MEGVVFDSLTKSTINKQSLKLIYLMSKQKSLKILAICFLVNHREIAVIYLVEPVDI